MINEQGRVSDGLTTLVGGMDSGRSPALLKPDQCSYASNVSFRGGFAKTRPAFKRLSLTGAGATAFKAAKFQGAYWFVEDNDEGYIIAVADGKVYRISPPTSEGSAWGVEDVTNGAPLRSFADRVWMVQAKENPQKNYLIIQDGESLPHIYDPIDGGRYSDVANKEVPQGSGPMGFGHGRLWVAQGSNFLAGDIATLLSSNVSG